MENQRAEQRGESPELHEQKQNVKRGQDTARASMLADINAKQGAA